MVPILEHTIEERKGYISIFPNYFLDYREIKDNVSDSEINKDHILKTIMILYIN